MAESTVATEFAGPPDRGHWLPASWVDQSCPFCGATPVWVHPLDPRHVRFHTPGRNQTTGLPTFWTVCERCETLVRAGDDDALVEQMLSHDNGASQIPGEAVAALAAFRAADLGAQPLLGP
jgi:hypothetical protein